MCSSCSIIFLVLIAVVEAQGNLAIPQTNCSAYPQVYQGCYSRTPFPHSGYTWNLVAEDPPRNYPGYNSVSNITLDICLTACRAHGFRYSSLDGDPSTGQSCYCSLSSPSDPKTLDSSDNSTANTCHLAPQSSNGCVGNPSQYCGSTSGADVYRDPSFGNTTASASGYNYLACFTNSGTSPINYLQTTTLTATACLSFCASASWPYAFFLAADGSSQNCGCGTEIQSNYQALESECSVPCNAAEATKCGGSLRTSVYLNTALQGCFAPNIPGRSAGSTYNGPIGGVGQQSSLSAASSAIGVSSGSNDGPHYVTVTQTQSASTVTETQTTTQAGSTVTETQTGATITETQSPSTVTTTQPASTVTATTVYNTGIPQTVTYSQTVTTTTTAVSNGNGGIMTTMVMPIPVPSLNTGAQASVQIPSDANAPLSGSSALLSSIKPLTTTVPINSAAVNPLSPSRDLSLQGTGVPISNNIFSTPGSIIPIVASSSPSVGTLPQSISFSIPTSTGLSPLSIGLSTPAISFIPTGAPFTLVSPSLASPVGNMTIPSTLLNPSAILITPSGTLPTCAGAATITVTAFP